MQNVPAPQSVSSFDPFVFSHVPAAANCHPPYAQEDCPDHQFVAMLDSYRDSGGLARTQEVLALFKRRGGPDVATLARWIVAKETICFEWQSQTWLPWFQFSPLSLTPRPELGQIVAQLASVCDAWKLAKWFVQPNPWLAERTPLDTLAFDLPAVLNAARADRCIAHD